MFLAHLPRPDQLGVDPEDSPVRRAVVLARLADEGLDPQPPMGLVRPLQVAPPEHELGPRVA